MSEKRVFATSVPSLATIETRKSRESIGISRTTVTPSGERSRHWGTRIMIVLSLKEMAAVIDLDG
jgi:hypothetical protein